MFNFESNEFHGLSDDVPTDEERAAVLALMDEPDLKDGEYDFIMDLAGQGDNMVLTGPMREWLERLIEKYGV